MRVPAPAALESDSAFSGDAESWTRLGVYEILGPLGAGGWARVYRATETKLKEHSQ
jgi:hypothetical protein